jgi:hopanoid biosynthesis associated radical SAM protein HpnH
VFDQAIAMIREAKARGYHVVTNTTVFKETEVAELETLCQFLTDVGVDGILISPGYQYESVTRDIFLTREEIRCKFKRVLELSRRYRFQSTPMFLEFAAGMRDYPCSPWSTVTFTPRGWKGPCYLIGKSYTFDWKEFWNGTDWDYWESRQDQLCQNCSMHSGFEASAVLALRRNPRDLARIALWNVRG